MISFVPWISNWASNYKLYWLISDPTEPRKIADKLYKKGWWKLSLLSWRKIGLFLLTRSVLGTQLKYLKTCLGQDLTSHFIWLSKTMTWHMTGHVMKIYNIPTRNIALTWAPYKSCLCTWMLRLCHRSMMDFIFSILFRVSLAGFEQILQKRPSVFL